MNIEKNAIWIEDNRFKRYKIVVILFYINTLLLYFINKSNDGINNDVQMIFSIYYVLVILSNWHYLWVCAKISNKKPLNYVLLAVILNILAPVIIYGILKKAYLSLQSVNSSGG